MSDEEIFLGMAALGLAYVVLSKPTHAAAPAPTPAPSSTLDKVLNAGVQVVNNAVDDAISAATDN